MNPIDKALKTAMFKTTSKLKKGGILKYQRAGVIGKAVNLLQKAVKSNSEIKPKTYWNLVTRNTSDPMVVTHNISPKYLMNVLNGKWNKTLPNPSLAVWNPKAIDNGYGDVLLIGDRTLFKDSHFYPTDGGTASVTHLNLGNENDVYKISSKILKHDNNNVSKFRISENDLLQKEIVDNLFSYSEVKRSVPTSINEFKHAFVPNNPDLHKLLDLNKIPYSVIEYGDDAMKNAVSKYIETHPEVVLNRSVDKYVSTEALMPFDDLPEISNSLIQSQNTFYPYTGDKPHFELGINNLKEYFKSNDYKNQIKKNFPDILDSEINDIVDYQIKNINNSNIWYSDRNIIDPLLHGETSHLADGIPEIQIFQSGDKGTDRLVLMHELLHGARGPKLPENKMWQKLVESKLVGNPIKGQIVTTNGKQSPLGIPDLTYNPGKDLKGMEYLAYGDEARIRALLLRYAMQKSWMSYDDASKYFYAKDLTGKPLGGVSDLHNYFTPESVKKYVDKVFTIGMPIVGSTIYNKHSK